MATLVDAPEIFRKDTDPAHFNTEQVGLDPKQMKKLIDARELIGEEAYEASVSRLRAASEQLDPEPANFDLLRSIVSRYRTLDPAYKGTARARQAAVVALLSQDPAPVTAEDNDADGVPKYTDAIDKLVEQVHDINGGAWSTMRSWCNVLGDDGKPKADTYFVALPVLDALDGKAAKAKAESERKEALAKENKAKREAGVK